MVRVQRHLVQCSTVLNSRWASGGLPGKGKGRGCIWRHSIAHRRLALVHIKAPLPLRMCMRQGGC